MTKTMMRTFGLPVALAAALGAAGCFSERVAEPEDTEPCTGTCEVTILDFAFTPATRRISAGSTVRWVNDGPSPHTAEDNDGAWDSGNLNDGQSFERVFPTTGTFEYFCEYHTSMQGTIIVQ